MIQNKNRTGIVQSEEKKEKMRKIMESKWKDPEYRAMIIKRQEEAGLRAYGSKLNNHRKKYE